MKHAGAFMEGQVKRRALIIVALGLLSSMTMVQGQWGVAKRLTWTAGDSYNPAIAIDSNNAIHVVWDDDTPAGREIFYRRSTDGGTTWSGLQQLTLTPGTSSCPAMAIDSSDRIHVVWHDYAPGNPAIYYRRSIDGGLTWAVVRRLTWNSGPALYAAIARGMGDEVHVVWVDNTPGNDEVFYKRSLDGGSNWSASKRLTWSEGNSWYPDIGVDQSNAVDVVWTEYSASANDIYFKRSADGGFIWSAAKRLTWNSGNSFTPAMALDSYDVAHVIWKDDTSGNDEIYYRRSANGGATWSPASRLTWMSGAKRPAIAIDSSDVIHMVCYYGESGDREIYYKKSTDGGTVWSALQKLTGTSGWSDYPAVDVDSNLTVHVVWIDDTPGNYEIYYKKGNLP